MTIEERRKKLEYARGMAKATQKRIRRLNTALKSWQRRAAMHEKALAALEVDKLNRRIRDLESQVLKPRRAITLEG